MFYLICRQALPLVIYADRYIYFMPLFHWVLSTQRERVSWKLPLVYLCSGSRLDPQVPYARVQQQNFYARKNHVVLLLLLLLQNNTRMRRGVTWCGH